MQTTTMVSPCSWARSRTVSMMDSWFISSWETGSSVIDIARANALAIITRCNSPPLILFILLSASVLFVQFHGPLNNFLSVLLSCANLRIYGVLPIITISKLKSQIRYSCFAEQPKSLANWEAARVLHAINVDCVLSASKGCHILQKCCFSRAIGARSHTIPGLKVAQISSKLFSHHT